jgi:hypothetical protein
MATLLTKPLLLKGSRITVNANVVGEMRVRLVGERDQGLKDFDWVSIQGDAVDIPVKWKGDLASLSNTPVRLEFQFQDAQLFSFDLYE